MTSLDVFTITCGRCSVSQDVLEVEWSVLWAALPCEQHRRTRGALWLPTLPRPEGFEEIPTANAVRRYVPSTIVEGSGITFHEEVREVQTWQVSRLISPMILDESPRIIPALVADVCDELATGARARGCTHVSEIHLSIDRDWTYPYPLAIDPRGRWRHLWDRLRRRPSWTAPPPPPPPYRLVGEIRCA